MSLSQHSITQQDLAGVGVIGMADTPGLSTAAMQAKLEETARSLIIPRFNAALADADAALAADGEALAQRPTVWQMDEAIAQQMAAIGAGDMAKAVYGGSADGVVADSDKLGGQPAAHYAAAEAAEVAHTAAAAAQSTADAAMPRSAYVLEGATLTITF